MSVDSNELGLKANKLIMRPSYTAEDYLCVYDSKEDAKGRTVLHVGELEWMDLVRNDIDS